MNKLHQIAGHTLTLLRNGEEYFPRLIETIDAAAHSVYLETYIYANDGTGNLIAAAMQRAAQRGVDVRLLLDGFGSAELPQSWLDSLRATGIEVMWYRKEIGHFSFKRYRLRRLHRKLVTIDGRIAFVGGINIIDDAPEGVGAPRLDYAVQVEGEVARNIHASMLRLWLLLAWTRLPIRGGLAKIRRLKAISTQQQVTFLIRDNFRHRRDIERAYLKAIAGAQHEIIIANAYFLPGRKFRRALLDAAQRGVRVVLFLQGMVEYRLQHYATLALYDKLLRAGIEIHEYRPSFMHAKVAVVDAKWATIGSSNIDPFSLWLAREANLAVMDAGFATALREELLKQMQHNAQRVSISVWRDINIFSRMAMRISYAIARLLAVILVYRKGRDDF